MFTGIVQAVGRVAALEPAGDGRRMTIESPELELGDVAVGDSIAVAGTCLTAVTVATDRWQADVSPETLRCTTLGGLRPGDPVNLEKALLPTTRLGGHLVSGHIDGTARVRERADDGEGARLWLEVPQALARYVAVKGSICVDGVSLTVNSVAGAAFLVYLIPHTLAQTTLSALGPGAAVNIEVDLLARYVERLVNASQGP